MKRTRRPLRTLLAAALALAAVPAVADDTFSDTIFFGDSLTDAGRYRGALVLGFGPDGAIIGRFTTNPDMIWAEYLADFYGGNAAPVGYGVCTAAGCATVETGLPTGDNYATGGARNGVDGTSDLAPGLGVPVPSILTQVETYLAATGGTADPDALYTVWGGSNDMFAIAGGAPAAETMAGAVGAQVTAIGMLQAAGARYVLMPNVPDLGLTPSFLASGQGPTGTLLASTYNDALFDALAGAGLRVIPVDVFSLIQEITADPGTYGFTNVTGTACLPEFTASSLTCNPGNFASPDAPDTYAFADGVHPTGAAHEIIADLAVGMIEGPRQIAVLPHSAAMVGRARAARVSARAAGRAGGEGLQWWADARGDFQRYERGDAYDGAGPTVTVGVDRAEGNVVFGAFAGFGRQDLDWGLRRGSFEQDDATVGAYLGWSGDGPWANGQLSWTRLVYDIAREVQLGPATRVHRGSPGGTNLTVGIDAGWTFGEGALRHGPVLAVLSQQVEVDGYAEDNLSSSALAYPDQSFDSLIGSVGWQASYVAGAALQPYARVTLDRQFEDAAEQAFAQALSIPGSLPYAVPGLELDDRYGTVTFGARTHLFGMDANLGASTTVSQGSGTDATVFVTLGKGF